MLCAQRILNRHAYSVARNTLFNIVISMISYYICSTRKLNHLKQYIHAFILNSINLMKFQFKNITTSVQFDFHLLCFITAFHIAPTYKKTHRCSMQIDNYSNQEDMDDYSS